MVHKEDGAPAFECKNETNAINYGLNRCSYIVCGYACRHLKGEEPKSHKILYGPCRHGRPGQLLYSLAEWTLNWGRRGHSTMPLGRQPFALGQGGP